MAVYNIRTNINISTNKFKTLFTWTRPLGSHRFILMYFNLHNMQEQCVCTNTSCKSLRTTSLCSCIILPLKYKHAYSFSFEFKINIKGYNACARFLIIPTVSNPISIHGRLNTYTSPLSISFLFFYSWTIFPDFIRYLQCSETL